MKYLQLVLLLIFTSCADKNKINYSYFSSIVEKCVDYTFSSECVLSKGGLDFKTGLPVFLSEKPRRASDLDITFGTMDQPSMLELETLNEKSCMDLGKKRYIYYELIQKKGIFNIVSSSKLNIWCE